MEVCLVEKGNTLGEEIFIWALFLIIGIATAVLAKRWAMWRARGLKRSYPWLSKYIPYDKEKRKPVIFLQSQSLRPETWLLRSAGIAFAAWSLYNLIDIILS
jgi:hypothetical protein